MLTSSDSNKSLACRNWLHFGTAVFISLTLIWSAPLFAALAITHVTAIPAVIDIQQQQSSTIRFRVTQSAEVEINIYQADDRLVRHYQFAAPLEPGEHQWQWDGTDNQGQAVMPEAYYYTLSGKSKDEVVQYDLTDITGGDNIGISNVEYDHEEGIVRYALNQPARVFMRAQLAHGLLLDTLIDSEVRSPGKYQMPWAGKDASGEIDISRLDKLSIIGGGYRLPRNAIIVKNSQPDLAKQGDVSGTPQLSSRVRKSRSKKSNEHYLHSRAECRDFSVLLSKEAVPADQQSEKQILQFLVDLEPQDRAMVLSQRVEVSFFVDYKLLHENEISYVPYRWRLNAATLDAGEHTLTAVVIAYGSHVGTASMKFTIAEQTES